jgi:competence protein ComEC
VGALLLGAAVTNGRAHERLARRLAPVLAKRVVSVTGIVVGLPVWRGEGWRFDLRVEPDDAATHEGEALPAPVPPRLAVAWYPGENVDVSSARSGPRAGQRWRLRVRLSEPDGLVNPHGADPVLALFERGVLATAQVVTGAGTVPQRLAETGQAPVDRWRQDQRDRLRVTLGDTPAAGVLAALAVGDQAAIERDDWAVFRATGVSHLMAISGLHVTMFAWLAGGLLSRLWRLGVPGRWLMRRWPAPVAARWGGFVAALGYAVLAGWGVPAQRTVIMLGVVVLLRGGARRWPVGRLLLVAAVVVTLWDPWALLQPGFWLSFVAVALLTASGERPVGARERATGVRRGLGVLRDGARSQLVMTVGLAPWTLLFFQQLSLTGLLANAVAIPVVTLGITPLALLGLAVTGLWSLGSVAVEALRTGLAWLATLLGGVWSAPVAPGWAQGLGLLGATLLVLRLPWRVRVLGGPLLLPMLWPALPVPAAGEFELLAADIGQGNAVLIRTRGHALLYDTGPAYGRHGETGNAGERVLVPLLHALGVRRLDRLVITHRDTDHSGGAAAVLAAMPVTLLQSSLEPGHPLRQASVHQPCAAGVRWRWEGVDFTFLHPEPTDLDRPALTVLRPNAVSCVLRIDGRRRSVLLTGDIGVDQELRLVVRQRDRLAADVLLVPHHGSGTSSSLHFLNSVAPHWAIVQAGRHNRYGHPSAAVVARYRDIGTDLILTSQCGAWHWRSADASNGCAREQGRRYWWPVPVAGGPEIANSRTDVPDNANAHTPP